MADHVTGASGIVRRTRRRRAVGASSMAMDSLRLDPGVTDHLCPLLGIVCDELAELIRRVCKRLDTQIDQPSLECGIDEGYFRVEGCDDLRRRIRGAPMPFQPVAT
jgi:hypothetical protein